MKKFAGILKQAKAATMEEQLAVGGEIARVFAAVTFPSEVRGSRMDGDTFVAEVWWGKTLWRRVRGGVCGGAGWIR